MFVKQYLEALSPLLCALLAIPSKDDEQRYLEQQIQDAQSGSSLFFCIFEKFSNNLIGAIAIRRHATRGQLYNWVNEDFWGNGYYQEALQLVIPEYFKQFPNEVQFNARVDVSNVRSYYALQKAGFIVTGTYKGPRENQFDLVFKRSHCKSG